MNTLNDWMKGNFKPDPEILGMLEKAKKQEYNKKEEKNFGSVGAGLAPVQGISDIGRVTKNEDKKTDGISTAVSLAKSGAETAATAAKQTNTTWQKPKEATKTTSASQKPKQVNKTDNKKMSDYLYAKESQPKTQKFLFNNGFPSYEDREYDKEFYGEKEEKRRFDAHFGSRLSDILNPKLPDKEERLFLSGFWGDEEEERQYQKQVADNKKAKTELYEAFRGSPFEHFFTTPNPAPAGMPLKKQDPVEELMAKYEQYQKNKPADTTASKSDSEIKKEPTMWFENGDYAASHYKGVDPRLRYELHPAPENMDKTQNDSQKPVMHFENGDYASAQSENRWELHPAPKNLHITSPESNKTKDSVSDVIGDVSNIAGSTLKNFSEFVDLEPVQNFLVTPGSPLTGVNQAVAKGMPILKKSGKALGAVSTILSFGEAGIYALNDLITDKKLNDIESYKKLGSALGGWALSSGSAIVGAKAISAIGTLICPGIGTVVGGLLGTLGGFAFGLIGDYYGGKIGEYAGDKLGEAIIN